MKNLFKKVLASLGYELKKSEVVTHDLRLYYQLYEKKSVDEKRFYNIGAGNFYHPAWTNIDFLSEWYRANSKRTMQGIHYDLLSLEPIPVDSETGEVIYSSHTIEHITNEAAQNMFDESYRILKSGGIFRVTTPNIDLEYRAYKANDRNYFYWINQYSKPSEIQRAQLAKPMNQASIGEIFLHHFAASVSPLHADGAASKISDYDLEILFNEMGYEATLDYCIARCFLDIQKKYPGNHINWWNKDKLFRMLAKAGFKDVYLSGWGQSASPVLRDTNYFDTTHPKISIYVEAIK